MSRCDHCHQEMTTASSCTLNTYTDFADGEERARIRYGEEPYWAGTDITPPDRCGDCGVTPGGYHHPGCDQEICPACGRQALSCDCADGMLRDDPPEFQASAIDHGAAREYAALLRIRDLAAIQVSRVLARRDRTQAELEWVRETLEALSQAMNARND